MTNTDSLASELLFETTAFSQLNAPGGLGVYLKPAFNRGPAFINEVFFSAILSMQVDLLPPHLRSPGKVGQDGTGLLRVTLHHSKQDANYGMLIHSRCVKKEFKQYMHNIEAS